MRVSQGGNAISKIADWTSSVHIRAKSNVIIFVMKNLSKKNLYILESFSEGYDINEKGEFIRKDLTIKNKFRIGRNGYYNITLRLPSCERADVKIHKLQAYKKYGIEMFKDGIVVRHMDGNRLNNSWDNILIGTQSDNQMDIPKEIRVNSAIKASRQKQDNNRKYEERCKIYEDLKNNISYTDIMVKHGITSKGTLSFMKNKSIEYKEYLSL